MPIVQKTPPISGSCLCKAVQFELTQHPICIVKCHCMSCRKTTGAIHTVWAVIEHAHFHWLGMMPSSYASSPKVQRTFFVPHVALPWLIVTRMKRPLMLQSLHWIIQEHFSPQLKYGLRSIDLGQATSWFTSTPSRHWMIILMHPYASMGINGLIKTAWRKIASAF